MSLYPHVKITIRRVDDFKKKLELIRELLEKDIPSMITVITLIDGKAYSHWHSVPVVGLDTVGMKVIGTALETREGKIVNVDLSYNLLELEEMHIFGGNEVVWIEP